MPKAAVTPPRGWAVVLGAQRSALPCRQGRNAPTRSPQARGSGPRRPRPRSTPPCCDPPSQACPACRPPWRPLDALATSGSRPSNSARAPTQVSKIVATGSGRADATEIVDIAKRNRPPQYSSATARFRAELDEDAEPGVTSAATHSPAPRARPSAADVEVPASPTGPCLDPWTASATPAAAARPAAPAPGDLAGRIRRARRSWSITASACAWSCEANRLDGTAPPDAGALASRCSPSRPSSWPDAVAVQVDAPRRGGAGLAVASPSMPWRRAGRPPRRGGADLEVLAINVVASSSTHASTGRRRPCGARHR